MQGAQRLEMSKRKMTRVKIQHTTIGRIPVEWDCSKCVLGMLGGSPRKPGSTGEAGEVQRGEQMSGVNPKRHPGVSGTSDEVQSLEKSVTAFYVCVGTGGVCPWTLDGDMGGCGCSRASVKPLEAYKC